MLLVIRRRPVLKDPSVTVGVLKGPFVTPSVRKDPFSTPNRPSTDTDRE